MYILCVSYWLTSEKQTGFLVTTLSTKCLKLFRYLSAVCIHIDNLLNCLSSVGVVAFTSNISYAEDLRGIFCAFLFCFVSCQVNQYRLLLESSAEDKVFSAWGLLLSVLPSSEDELESVCHGCKKQEGAWSLKCTKCYSFIFLVDGKKPGSDPANSSCGDGSRDRARSAPLQRGGEEAVVAMKPSCPLLSGISVLLCAYTCCTASCPEGNSASCPHLQAVQQFIRFDSD